MNFFIQCKYFVKVQIGLRLLRKNETVNELVINIAALLFPSPFAVLFLRRVILPEAKITKGGGAGGGG